MELPKTLRILNLLLAGGIVVAGLFVVRQVATVSISGSDGSASARKQASRSAPAPTPDLLSYNTILEENPFGPEPAGPLTDLDRSAPAAEASRPIPEGLRLIGTIAGEAGMSFGIFEDRQKTQSVYSKGDEIEGHGTLVEVATDHVIIRGPRGDTRLELAELALPSVSAASRSRGAARNRRKPRTGSPPKEVAFIKKSGTGQYLLDKEGVQKSLQNPQRVLTDARMLPNFVEGKQEGFKVSEVIHGGVYDKLGLRNGDILLKINDLELNSPDSGIQAFSTLRGVDRIKLYIIRAEKRITQTYQIR